MVTYGGAVSNPAFGCHVVGLVVGVDDFNDTQNQKTRYYVYIQNPDISKQAYKVGVDEYTYRSCINDFDNGIQPILDCTCSVGAYNNSVYFRATTMTFLEYSK